MNRTRGHDNVRRRAIRLALILSSLLLVVAFAIAAEPSAVTSPTEGFHSFPAHPTDAHPEFAGEGAHGGEHKPKAGMPEPPNFITVLLHTTIGGTRIGDTHVGHFLHAFEKQIFIIIYTALLAFVVFGTLKLRALMPGKLQAFLEMIVEGFYKFIMGILGPDGKRFVPFLGSLWFFIWVNTLSGVIPFFTATTSIFQTTVTLAVIVFVYVQFHGIWENARGHRLGLLGGFGRWFHHLLGSPKDTIGWVLAPLMVVLHIIGELAKPLSLSLRLFGNIMGEDILLGVFLILGVMIGTAFTPDPFIGFPLHLPFFFLALLTSTIQATVFTLLSTIYLMMVLPHEEHDAHGEHGEPHPAHQPHRPGMPEDRTPHIGADGASHV
jgi:F-type H+-transporting ATPase subunit a